MSTFTFPTIQPDVVRPLREGLSYLIDNNDTRKIRALEPGFLTGAKAGTKEPRPGHYAYSSTWGYLSEGATSELEAIRLAAENVPVLPEEGALYEAEGGQFRFVALHPKSKDMVFEGSSGEHVWVLARTYHKHFRRVG